jgi:hypothetical protein
MRKLSVLQSRVLFDGQFSQEEVSQTWLSEFRMRACRLFRNEVWWSEGQAHKVFIEDFATHRRIGRQATKGTEWKRTDSGYYTS